MQFGLMYLFSEYGNVPQAQVFGEFLEKSNWPRNWVSTPASTTATPTWPRT